jgi:hypothetical protein
MLEALADRLQSASIAFAAQDLFLGLMPDQPDKCVALYEYAGAQPLEVLTNNSATLERPSVQVLVRAGRNDYPTGKALMEAVRDSLTEITNETISDQRFLRVNQISSINALGVDANDRPRFTLSLQVVLER